MRLRLMADYHCWPLWNDGGPEDNPHNVDPEQLGLSVELLSRLDTWQRRYDAQLDREVAQDSTWLTPDEVEAFNQEGEALAALLRSELGSDHEVRHQPQPRA